MECRFPFLYEHSYCLWHTEAPCCFQHTGNSIETYVCTFRLPITMLCMFIQVFLTFANCPWNWNAAYCPMRQTVGHLIKKSDSELHPQLSQPVIPSLMLPISLTYKQLYDFHHCRSYVLFQVNIMKHHFCKTLLKASVYLFLTVLYWTLKCDVIYTIIFFLQFGVPNTFLSLSYMRKFQESEAKLRGAVK